MKTSVSIQEKQAFLKWFMQYIEIESYEMNWFLQDLMDDERALLYVHFVQDVQFCPKGIIISTTERNDTSFLFFKGNVYTDDVYTAYHELHLYHDEAIYFQMNFPNSSDNTLLKTVLEDDKSFIYQTKLVTEEILELASIEGKKNYIKKEINKALENLDYDNFMYYSTLLKEM